MSGGSFIGRDALVARVSERLAGDAGWVTLVGPPGVGKTRLAREVATDRRERGEGEAIFCALRDARTIDDVIGSLTASLGLDLRGQEEIEQALTSITASVTARRGQLVLDDADRLDRDAIARLGDWHALGMPACILTARRRLDVPGELVIEVSPLEAPDALGLFRGLSEERSLAQADHADVAALVARLDGLPLALQLAAKRTRLLSPKELLARLDARFAVLRAGESSPLEEAVRLSWELLGPSERSVLTQLAVFYGGASLEDVEVVVEAVDGVIDALAELVERSLVVRRSTGATLGATRFSVFESVQDFALAHGEPARIDAARERHRARFVGEAERWAGGLRGEGAAECRARLILERENIEAALERSRADHPGDVVKAALGLERVLGAHTPLRASLSLMNKAVKSGREVGPALEARALAARGWLRQSWGDGERATTDLELARTRASAAGDPALEAEILGWLAHHCFRYGRLDEAHGLLVEAAAMCEAHGLESLSARIVDRFGLVALERGRLEEAVERFDEASRIHERHGDLRGVATAASSAAVAYIGLGRLSEARADIARVVRLAEALDDARYRGVALINRGLIDHEEARYDEAAAAYSEGLALLRSVGYRRAEASALGRSGLLALERGDAARGQAAFEAALTIYREHRYAKDASRCLGLLALLHFVRDDDARDVERARRELDAARKVAPDEAAEPLLSLVGSALAEQAWEPDPDAGAMQAASFPELRLASRMLSARVGGPRLRVGPSGTWFSLDGGAPVSLARRGPMRRVLVALGERHRTEAEAGIDVHALFDAAWPGQRARPEAAAGRVYEAVRMLRRLGLEGVLLKRDDGYLLDPAVSVEFVDL